MRMFPVVPGLFPHSYLGFLKFPVFRISCLELYGRSSLILTISSRTRNTGNNRNSVETARVGLSVHVEHWEQTRRMRHQSKMRAQGLRKPAGTDTTTFATPREIIRARLLWDHRQQPPYSR
jgi:hypothetical protein